MFDNLLEQDLTATAPNQKWVGDITYLWTDEGWLDLAVILDLFSRQVIVLESLVDGFRSALTQRPRALNDMPK